MIRKISTLVIRKQGAVIAEVKHNNVFFGTQTLFKVTVNIELCEIWGL
jgi:hypothetical protein